MAGIFSRLRGQTETTPVSKETEVGIPWQTYGKLLILGPVSIWGFWGAGCIAWMGVHLVQGNGWWQWTSGLWWPWMGRWWWMPLLLCFLWWASAPTWATIYRFLVETIIKNPPLYGEWKPENGMWHPFVGWRRRRLEKARLDETYEEQFGRRGWESDEGEDD